MEEVEARGQQVQTRKDPTVNRLGGADFEFVPCTDSDRIVPSSLGKGRTQSEVNRADPNHPIISPSQNFESPFSKEIKRLDPPRRFSIPKLRIYDGTSDPADHIQHYQHSMTLWVGNESLMCKVFPSSLGDLALKWFSRLKPRSIRSFRELARSCHSFCDKFQATKGCWSIAVS